MPDRRAGGSIPHVGKQPRSRTKSGKWRKKRSDAGKKRPAQSWWYNPVKRGITHRRKVTDGYH